MSFRGFESDGFAGEDAGDAGNAGNDAGDVGWRCWLVMLAGEDVGW